MALDSSLAGIKVGPIGAGVDARWTMAFAAGIDDLLPCYVDTRSSRGIVAHPLFPVCFEWPAAGEIRAKLREAMAPGEPARGVHATHQTIVHRPIRPPERLRVTAQVIGIERRRAGAYETTKFETIDEKGAAVCTTYYGSLYRGVEVKGADRAADIAPPVALASVPQSARGEFALEITAGAAHVYTECARIWNPIHTDAAAAAAAGLPGLILHGTATLARCVSIVVRAEAGNEPQRVAEIHGRFAAMVLMPSTVTVRIQAREATTRGRAIFFEAINAEGGRAIRDGVVLLRG